MREGKMTLSRSTKATASTWWKKCTAKLLQCSEEQRKEKDECMSMDEDKSLMCKHRYTEKSQRGLIRQVTAVPHALPGGHAFSRPETKIACDL